MKNDEIMESALDSILHYTDGVCGLGCCVLHRHYLGQLPTKPNTFQMEFICTDGFPLMGKSFLFCAPATKVPARIFRIVRQFKKFRQLGSPNRKIVFFPDLHTYSPGCIIIHE
jgi:hypothetical protein